MATQNIQVNDRQLACARINSQEGQDYLAAMVRSAYARVSQPNAHIACEISCGEKLQWFVRCFPPQYQNAR
jgi:hypothetical protein